MFDLEQAIRERPSDAAVFAPSMVPRALVRGGSRPGSARARPSNSNIQPWHMVFASGPPRDRLVKALLEEAQRRPPNIPPLPEAFRHYRLRAGALESTARWGLPARTRRAMTLPSCATGSSSAPRQPASSACTATSARRTP